jgi:outer membrane immunogenic protein
VLRVSNPLIVFALKLCRLFNSRPARGRSELDVPPRITFPYRKALRNSPIGIGPLISCGEPEAYIMRLYSILIIAAACLASAGTAQAGGSLKDGPMPGPPPGRCIGGAFAGPYAGVQLGFGSTRSRQDGGGDEFSDNDRGFTGGGFGGYNVQCGRVLFGVETDFNYYGTDTETGVECPTCGSTPLSASFQSSMDWFGTLRGRLGLVGDDHYLIYATAGLAYANVDHRFETNIGPGGGVLAPPFSASSGGTQLGWTVGGGVEFLKDENWSLKAEALYVDLGSDDESYTLTTGCGGTCTAHVNWDDSFWVVRLGLAYHFNRPETVVDYAPLK